MAHVLKRVARVGVEIMSECYGAVSLAAKKSQTEEPLHRVEKGKETYPTE